MPYEHKSESSEPLTIGANARFDTAKVLEEIKGGLANGFTKAISSGAGGACDSSAHDHLPKIDIKDITAFPNNNVDQILDQIRADRIRQSTGHIVTNLGENIDEEKKKAIANMHGIPQVKD